MRGVTPAFGVGVSEDVGMGYSGLRDAGRGGESLMLELERVVSEVGEVNTVRIRIRETKGFVFVFVFFAVIKSVLCVHVNSYSNS